MRKLVIFSSDKPYAKRHDDQALMMTILLLAVLADQSYTIACGDPGPISTLISLSNAAARFGNALIEVTPFAELTR